MKLRDILMIFRHPFHPEFGKTYRQGSRIKINDYIYTSLVDHVFDGDLSKWSLSSSIINRRRKIIKSSPRLDPPVIKTASLHEQSSKLLITLLYPDHRATEFRVKLYSTDELVAEYISKWDGGLNGFIVPTTVGDISKSNLKLIIHAINNI